MTTTFAGKWQRIAYSPGPLSEEYIAYGPKKRLSIGGEVAPMAFYQKKERG